MSSSRSPSAPVPHTALCRYLDLNPISGIHPNAFAAMTSLTTLYEPAQVKA